MPTKTHPERDFFNRATAMLKAYEALEDFTPFSKYSHEVFVEAWINRIACLKEKRNPIDFLQIPFRIAEFNDNDTIKKQYKAYIETVQKRLGENTNTADHFKKYQKLSPEERPERIFDDGGLFPENDSIALEFNFAYRFAQYAQICIEQENDIFIDVFLGCLFEPTEGNSLPDELRNVLNNNTITDNPKDFWEKWKDYFSPNYMNMEELDKFLKIFILSIDKEHPEKIALKEILLKARLYNVIFYPVDELDNPSEGLFLKLSILKKFTEGNNIDLEPIKDKLKGITPEHDLSKTKECFNQRWPIATLLKFFSNIGPLIDQIKNRLTSNNTNKSQLEQNQELLSGRSQFPILDKIELPIKRDNEPKWLYPLAQLFFRLKQNPQDQSWITFVFSLVIGETPIIEGDDPSELVPEFLVLLALAEFMSMDTRSTIVYEKVVELPNTFNPNIVFFRSPLIMGQIFAHPKISKFLTYFDFTKVFSIDLFKNFGEASNQLSSVLNQKSVAIPQDAMKFIDSISNQMKQATSDNMGETVKSISSMMQDFLQQQASQQEKNDPENDNEQKLTFNIINPKIRK